MDEMGSGEDSRIYRARYRPADNDPERLGLEYGSVVVLKVLRGDMGLSQERIEGFNREAELLVMMNHPGLVKAITRGITNGRVWMALEYVEGESLRTVWEAFEREQLRMKPQVALMLATDLCAAMAAAHGLTDARGDPLGVVHRSLSPMNVMLDINGGPKVVDWGRSLLSDREFPTGEVIGIPGYMAPEQAKGERVTAAADVYAIGLILFELLTSRRAYPVESLPESIRLQTHRDARRLGWPDHFEISGRIRAIVDAALHEDPTMRPPNAAALFQMLSPMVKEPDASRHALRVVARDLVRTNADRPEPLFV
jgi:serine/threonine protein kinase